MREPERAVAAMLRAVNCGDLDAVAVLAPGNERFRDSHRRMLTAFPDVHIDLEWTVTEADKSVAWAHIQGTHRGEWRGIAARGKVHRKRVAASAPDCVRRLVQIHPQMPLTRSSRPHDDRADEGLRHLGREGAYRGPARSPSRRRVAIAFCEC